VRNASELLYSYPVEFHKEVSSIGPRYGQDHCATGMLPDKVGDVVDAVVDHKPVNTETARRQQRQQRQQNVFSADMLTRTQRLNHGMNRL
jgi:hypothetical protein